MKTKLEEIYYDNECLAEKIPESEEFKKIHYECDELFGKLNESLNEEQQAMLDKLYYLMGGLESETGITNFKEGFKLGVKLIVEGLGK